MPKRQQELAQRLKKFRRRSPPGTPPGTIVADKESIKPRIRVIAYGIDEFFDKYVKSHREIKAEIGKYKNLWVDVDGLGDADTIAEIGKLFGLHRLALEDVVNVHQRPKVDSYESFDYIVLNSVVSAKSFLTEQISIFLGDDFIVTFQEKPGDNFDPIRERIRKSTGRIRRSGPDYLAYTLIDTIIDSYFPLAEEFARQIESLESHIFSRSDILLIKESHEILRHLVHLNRTIFNHSEVISGLSRNRSGRFSEETGLYLRDCYDHTHQLLDFLSTYRETGRTMIQLFLSLSGHRSNEIMKVLTVIASIFIPLTFIAGVYGMNFNTKASPYNMPELEWYLGYPFALMLMSGSAFLMLVYFYKKKWIGSGRSRDLKEIPRY